MTAKATVINAGDRPTAGRLTGPRLALDVWRAGRGGSEGIQRRQQTRLMSLIGWARAASLYYQEALRSVPSAGPISLEQLPVSTKAQMMENFDDWVTDRSVTRAAVSDFIRDPSRVGDDFLGKYMVVTTSGSTGLPAFVVFDHQALSIITAIGAIRGVGSVSLREWWRVFHNGGRQCAVYATGGHFLAETFMQRRLRQRPLRRRFARLFSVLDPLEDVVDQINRFRPAFLGSYPSMLDSLAREQEAGRLSVQPAIVTSGGEHLSPLVKSRLVHAWGCRVWDSYNATEAMPLTVPCRLGRFHVNADWIILEPVDADRRPVPPGHPSTTTLVTNLANRIQPIIRYELGDSVTIAPEPCRCGSPMPVVEVIGRLNDVLHLTGNDGRRIDLLPLALGSIIEETRGVRRYQVIQTGASTIEVRLEEEPGADPQQAWAAVQARLRDFLAQQGLPEVTLIRDPQSPQADPGSGKLRQVLSHVPTIS